MQNNISQKKLLGIFTFERIDTAIKIIAGVCLLFAGMIHSFPFVWEMWSDFVLRRPEMHYIIGRTALLLGGANLFMVIYTVLRFRERRNIE